LKSLKTSDFTTIVNEGCIFFKQEQFEKALSKFNDAIKICGFNPELYYNMALTYFEMHQHREALIYLDTIITKAYEQYPSLKHVSSENPTFEKDKNVASAILRDSSIVEALNL